jgi:hypothetical protein
MRLWPTSTRHDPIKASSNRFPIPPDHLVPHRKQEPRWLPFRSWPVCTMIIEGLLKEERTGSTLHERVEARQRVIVVGKDSFGGRPLVLHLSLPGVHAARKPLFFLPDGSFLSSSCERNRFPLPLTRVECPEKRPSCLATPPSMKKRRMGADVLTQRSFPNSAVRASRKD